ncbi:MAG: hypothetical protein JWP19_441 [Rhodoglobus sp.]|nr:hypothetical protein [Rhodoglobus sp.]
MILAGALLAGTSGCTFMAQQATLIHYDPSDGVGTTVGDVDVRNVIALASDDGKAFSLLVTFINKGSKIANVNLQYVSGTGKTAIMKSVRSSDTASFGNAVGQPQIIILNPGVKPGALYPVYFQVGDSPGKELLVPVLDATLPQYKDLKPPDILRN